MSSGGIAPPRMRALDDAERTRRAAGWVRSASARVYLPACTIALAAAVLVAVGWATEWGRSDFAGSVTALRAVVAGPATLVILSVFLVVERTWPAQRRPIFARGYRHDLLFAFVNALLVVPLVTALTLAFVDVL